MIDWLLIAQPYTIKFALYNYIHVNLQIDDYRQLIAVIQSILDFQYSLAETGKVLLFFTNGLVKLPTEKTIFQVKFQRPR